VIAYDAAGMGREGSPLRDRVIFVEGAPRSGTTWLVTLLATHPEIAGVEAESHLFDFGVDRLFDNLEGRDPYFHGLASYLDRGELVDLVRDFCDGALLAMRSHVSAGATPAFVVEKTPIAGSEGALDLERKRDVYPDAWYIHIVRDREAVARSLMRAPWMPDRSYAACARLWDRTVDRARSTLGDLPRYREVSYEALRDDPASACRELFEWLGIASGERVLETVRVLAREQFSELGAVKPGGGIAGRSTPATSARAALRRRGSRLLRRGSTEKPDSALTFRFVRALRERDADMLRSLTAPSLEVVYRSADGDLLLREEEARDALVRIAEDTFSRRYVGEWWASPGAARGEWWTSTPGKTLSTIAFSALGGDATRVDLAIVLAIDEGLVRRAVVLAASPLAGRPIARVVVSAAAVS
jgi:Sulfotransferase family